MTENICLYHGNCVDGFTAAWVLWTFLEGAPCEFIPVKYQSGHEHYNVSGKNVYILDFSFKPEVLLKMAAEAKSIVLLDHHISAQKDLESVNFKELGFPNVEIIFDMKRSGAMLAWNYFFPNKEAPLALQAVEDRDLWLFKLEKTKEICACLFSYQQTFEQWLLLMNDKNIKIMIAQGESLIRKQERDIKEMAALTQTNLFIDGYIVPCCNVPPTLASDMGHYLLSQDESAAFSATFYHTKDTWNFSLRSAGNRTDVSKVAYKFGGGGHRNAAGFKVSHDQENDIFNKGNPMVKFHEDGDIEIEKIGYYEADE